MMLALEKDLGVDMGRRTGLQPYFVVWAGRVCCWLGRECDRKEGAKIMTMFLARESEKLVMLYTKTRRLREGKASFKRKREIKNLFWEVLQYLNRRMKILKKNKVFTCGASVYSEENNYSPLFHVAGCLPS